MSSSKLGAGSLRAFLRQGHKEIAQVVPAFKDAMQVVEEPGVIGNLTPQEIYAQKQGERDYEPEM